MKRKSLYIIIIAILILTMLIVSLKLKDEKVKLPGASGSPQLHNTGTHDNNTTLEPTIDPTAIPVTYKEITVISSGDIMFHMPQIRSALNSETGMYDFSDSFKYIKQLVTDADYAVCNFETTLAGLDNGFKYSGYPRFNAPDSTLDSIKGAGFDMLLLSNNHTYDTGRLGLLRTQLKAREKGLEYIGTKDESSESFIVKEINGINIGFLNYSYESSDTRRDDGIMINGIFVKKEDATLINTFNYSYKNDFYKEVEDKMTYMKQKGADLFIMYIHWGSEYQLRENAHQKEIAQKLSNLGIDVIIGSHPHVIQPMEVLTSETTEEKTLCFYSLGNFISNQNRRTLTNPSTPISEYTENGVLVNLTIRKYSTGETYVSYLNYTPTWVHRIDLGNSKLKYQILPLPMAYEHPDSYGLFQTTFGKDHSVVTKERTDSSLRPGVDLYNEYIKGLIDKAA